MDGGESSGCLALVELRRAVVTRLKGPQPVEWEGREGWDGVDHVGACV